MLLTLLALSLAATPEFSFAFTNADGTQLLALPPVTNPVSLNRVVCDGRVLDVKYLREQPKGAKDTGRQTARNFAQVKGALFRLVKGTMPADALCLLGTAKAFSKRTFAAVTPETGERCEASTATLMGELGKRKVTRCIPTGSFPGGRLAFASYETEGDSALAAVALFQDQGAAALRRFPAKWEKRAPSCWRADDGCEFDATSYRVAFSMRGPAGLELYSLWAGPEGENAEVLRVTGGELKVIASGGRYWSPE
ncbi:MAG: hypothetical protein Q8L48_39910 [Archangium sp.]|nr:hypothetical protein [Archangium sp.]